MQEDLSAVVSDLRDTVKNEEGSNRNEEAALEIDAGPVESAFRRVKQGKASGPDNIGGRLLKSCSVQLSSAFSELFSWLLKDPKVPSIWKNADICLVPKSRRPSQLNPYRPVALSSIVMKCFECIVLKVIFSKPEHFRNPLQFAYRKDRSTDDTTFTLLSNVYTHVEKPASFFSRWNTIH